MRNKKRNLLLRVGTFLGAGLFLFQVKESYTQIRLYNLDSLNWTLISIALLLMFFMSIAQMVAWFSVMRSLGISLRLRCVLQGYWLSFLPRYIPGSVWGYLGRSQWLEQTYNIDYADSISGSILEAFGFLYSVLGIMGLYLCITISNEYLSVIMAFVVLIIVVLGSMIFPALVGKLVQTFKPRVTLARIRYRSWWLFAMIVYFVFWVFYGGAVWLIAGAFSHVDLSFIPAAIFSSATSWALGFIMVFIPAGLGVRELTLTLLLRDNLGLLFRQAESVSIIARFFIVVVEMVFLLFGVLLNILNSKHHSGGSL